ncbi:hypothetical protein C8F01DRAFT_1255672 [Mycena amicta]|nr:hypothetical protein C8F01DRAFT_1255672 [Mycena amicta]
MSRDGHNDVVFPKEAWAAIALNHRSLRELDVVVSGLGEEQNAWFPLTLPVYPHLRVLRVNLPDAHGWHCEELQKMLDRHCPVLEDLALQLPMCCGPSGITLLNTHPHLKSFELESTHLCSSAEDRGAGEDFLVRHPQIQRLSLRSDHYLHPAGPQSKLRALRIDQSTILTIRARLFGPTQDDSDLSSFALSAYGTDITHLRLVNVPHLSSPLVPGVVRSLAHTLRCLELDREDFRSFKVLLEHIRELLADATQLEELAIMGANSWPISPYWTVNHLRDLLSVLSKIPALPLRAIRFFSHSNGVQAEPLPAQFLEDMGSMPDRLEYIRWDVFRLREDDVQSTLYRVERVKDGRLESNKACLMHEARLPWSQRRADWTGESILDHLA